MDWKERVKKVKENTPIPKDFEDGLCPICKGNLEPHLPCCTEMCISEGKIPQYENCEECLFTTWELRRGCVDFEGRKAIIEEREKRKQDAVYLVD